MATWREVPITQGPDGLYHAKATVGRRANGQLDRRHRSGRSEAEVRRKLRELFKEVDAGTVRRPGRAPTVTEWFTTWLTDIAPYGRRALAPRSLSDYWSKCRNWIFPHLGGIRLDALDPDHLDALYAAMRRAGKAESHVLKVHAILRRGLGIAQLRGRTVRNVALLVETPGGGAPQRTPIDTDVIHAIVDVARQRRNAARWLVGLCIGSRQGEALGLCWPTVDLDEGTVDVAWQLQRLPWQHGCDDPHVCGRGRHRFKPCRAANRGAFKGRCSRHTGPRGCPPVCTKDCKKHASSCPRRRGGGLALRRPKTWRPGSAPRVVALPDELVVMLREHRRDQAAERLAAGTAWRRMAHPEGGEADLVFRQVDGAPIDPRQDWQEWQDILTAAGVKGSRVHAMRHTAATLLIDNGVDIAVIQEVLGHADIRTTRGYATVRTEATRGAARKIGGAVFGRPVTDLVTERQVRRSS